MRFHLGSLICSSFLNDVIENSVFHSIVVSRDRSERFNLKYSFPVIFQFYRRSRAKKQAMERNRDSRVSLR